MTIRVTPESDVYVTASDYRRYVDEYRRTYSYYSGTPPTLEEFIRKRQKAEERATYPGGWSPW